MATDSTSTSRASARPSSSTSDALLGGIFARGGAAAEVGDAALLQAMLDVEAAYARACATAGLIPAAHAGAIAAAAVADRYDIAALGAEAARHATPVIGLVAALQRAVGEDVARSVHRGLTSQDVVDTALMLVARRALEPILADARAAADAAALLAEAHRDTLMVGRTLLQPAQPTTFGRKAAGWLVGLDEARAELARTGAAVLAAQLGGAVGDRAALAAWAAEHGAGDGARAAAAIAEAVAVDLGLADPTLPWHGDRRRPATLAAALGVLAGAAAKVAKDVALLAQGEVAEASEGDDAEGARGGSSAMAHKRNPVAAVATAACAARTPALVATMLSVMDGEHERAAGGWQAEWETLRELLRSTGAAVAWVRDLLERLAVDAARMEANLDTVLGDAAGARQRTQALAAAGPLVDRALAAHRSEA
jgi:3-carboxy-cis,cis-muconate cycloisomerase